MNESRHAILFKASDDEGLGERDPYARQLESIGIHSHILPVVQFEFVNLDELNTRLDHPDLYSGIIFSSPRCVEAVKMSINDASLWTNHRAFVVGEKTAKDVYVQLGMIPEGQASGNGKDLSKFILEQDITKPLLLPVGNLSTDTIVTALRAGGLKVDQLVVYNTITNPKLEMLFRPIFDEFEVSFLLYFSPSGVDSTIPLFEKLKIDLNGLKIGAIGKTTEEALIRHSIQPAFVAEKPNPACYAKALQEIL
ncbi:uroporphyrinogen-III synthase [Cimex lectularius]|uniref:Uroporphyrinogen-III synthase n=1 Tax=Cimex lectularius TaxID=79782 RepID=A0A8I6R9L1_CIMLE|nr:uroporphyrinogen-III synthase [Cimex lectularius]